MMMDVRPIRDDADLTWALAEVAPYFDEPPQIGSAEAARFDVLSSLIASYEDRHHRIDPSSPVEVLRYAIDSLGRTQSDLARVLGSRSRASEVLAGRRPLTLDMIRAISAAWKLPVAALIEDVDQARLIA